MNAEIRQNNQSILQGDEISISVIFNNLIGKNFQGKEYAKYIDNIAFKEMGFKQGTIEFFKDNKLVKVGEITYFRMGQTISIGDSYLLTIRIAQELNLSPNGVIYADLYEQGELHPSGFLHFENFAKEAEQKIIKADLVEQAKQTKAYRKF